MRQHPNKIPAFTLSEVLVVLVITSIVVAIAFTVLRLVTKQFTAIQARYEERTEITMLKQRLLFDFDKAKSTSWSEKDQALEIVLQDEVIQYEITSDYILRDTDTLSFKIQNTTFYYLGDQIEEGEIDGLTLDIIISGRPIQFFVSRRLDAQQEMEKLWE